MSVLASILSRREATPPDQSIEEPTRQKQHRRPAGGAAISIDRLTKRYGSLTVVDDVSLDVRPAEFVSLLGPSGSGKTTLLMMIAGFESPASGTIRIAERDVTRIAPNKRNVGMVFQRYALFPHMTVEQNVAYPLRMRRTERRAIKERVRQALSLVRLEEYGARMPNQLSGGQQQRVAVARALVFEPPVLLMDEPLGALDKKLREQMQIEIKRIQRALGVTVIYVTHDQEEALTMSDRVAVMDRGRLVQTGTPVELYNDPATPFVADFIGKTNFIPADCRAISTSSAVVEFAPGCTVEIPAGRLRGAAAIGGRLRVAVRPEQMRLAQPGASGPAALPGTVEAVIFVGSFQVCLVRSVQDVLLHVQVPAASGGWREGDDVDVVLDPGTLHLFADAG